MEVQQPPPTYYPSLLIMLCPDITIPNMCAYLPVSNMPCRQLVCHVEEACFIRIEQALFYYFQTCLEEPSRPVETVEFKLTALGAASTLNE